MYDISYNSFCSYITKYNISAISFSAYRTACNIKTKGITKSFELCDLWHWENHSSCITAASKLSYISNLMSYVTNPIKLVWCYKALHVLWYWQIHKCVWINWILLLYECKVLYDESYQVSLMLQSPPCVLWYWQIHKCVDIDKLNIISAWI